jgi:peptidoglycan/xylan/chitin deacetylase (PgdA/CDA1 family)
MISTETMPTKWPNGAKAAFSITMDNMGEAHELYANLWPKEKPLGEHPAVKVLLPQLLDILDQHDMKATYFVEAWNADYYPAEIQDLAARGHEISWHGFQHENWTKLDLESAQSLWEKSQANIGKLGLQYKGFRPPGGLVPEAILNHLGEQGIRYLSPAGSRAAFKSNLAILPFEWQYIDAYYYLSLLGGLRSANGDTTEPLSVGEFVARIKRKIDVTVADQGYFSLLFHPFLQDTPERLAAMAEILTYVKSIHGVWVAPCIEVAEWVSSHPGQFDSDPGWDTSSWR